jgi:prephenate dehydratase
VRIGYLGPPGTFSEQALLESGEAAGAETVALPTVRETVVAVQAGEVDRAIAPIENSLEGTVNEAIDALVHEAPDVRIIGEAILDVRQALVTREPLDPAKITAVYSHPQALAQCARTLRRVAPRAELHPTASTAEAVRIVCDSPEPLAALAGPLSAERYGAHLLEADAGDSEGNMTRFVWLGREGEMGSGDERKTAIVFSGPGDDSPGWLVGCLSEFSLRGVNLTRIESRPSRLELGHYLFLIDVSGPADGDGPTAEAIEALAGHCRQLRILGSFPAAR